MKRREALALVATLSVPLAGCSSGDGGDETNETASPNGTDNSTDDPVDDPSDDGNSSDGDDDPTEEELAQEDVDAAQSALQSAVDELSEQGAADSGLGEDDVPVTAAVSGLSAGPVRDELSSVQSAIDDAREHETTGDQADTLDALESAAEWLHTVLDAHQPVRDLFLEANYALQDHIAEDASADLQAVRREADQAQSSVDDAAGLYSVPEVNGVDAIATDGVDAQADRLAADLESGRSVADIIEDLREAEDLWEQGLEHMQADERNAAADDYEAGMSAYGNMSVDGLSGSYSEARDYSECYSASMEPACERAETAALYFASEDNEEARQIYEEAQAHRSDAQNCSFDWSA